MSRSLSGSALLVTVLSALSSAIALLVDAATAAHFGASHRMDAFLTATVIPNILAMTIPTTLSVVFVPIFHKIVAERGEQEAWQVASKIFNALGLILTVLALLSLPFAESIIRVTAPGFAPELVGLSSELFRWMMVAAIFIGLNAILTSFYNATYSFGLPAFMPIARNVITLLGIVLLAQRCGIVILAWLAVAAGIAQFVMLAPVLVKKGRYCWAVSLNDPEIRDALRLSLIMLIGSIAYSGYGIVDRYVGSYLPEGSISYLGYANKIGMFFSNIVSVGIGTVAFSRFSSQAAAGDHKALATDIVRVLSVITLILLPALAVVLALREPLLGLVFKRKAFTEAAVMHTGYALVGYVGLLVVMGIGRPITLAFYSLRDTMTPVIINTVSLLFYVPLVYFLCSYLHMGYLGIAVGTSLIHVINCCWYVVVLRKKLGMLDLAEFYGYAGKILSCAALVAAICLLAQSGIKSLVSGAIADVLSLVAGFMAWMGIIWYLLKRKDVYLVHVYASLKSRFAGASR